MFYINVRELMMGLLPRPRLKNPFKDDRAEPINELPIITVRCDLNEAEGFYNKF